MRDISHYHREEKDKEKAIYSQSTWLLDSVHEKLNIA